MRAPYISKGCFGCGTENEHALGLHPRIDGDDRLVADLSVAARFRGFSRVAHGGITTALLDEMMGMVVGCLVEGRTVTARLEIDFLKPLIVETPVRLESWYVGEEGRYHVAEARALGPDGQELARGRGRFLAIGEDKALAFMGRPLGDGTGRNSAG